MQVNMDKVIMESRIEISTVMSMCDKFIEMAEKTSKPSALEDEIEVAKRLSRIMEVMHMNW